MRVVSLPRTYCCTHTHVYSGAQRTAKALATWMPLAMRAQHSNFEAKGNLEMQCCSAVCVCVVASVACTFAMHQVLPSCVSCVFARVCLLQITCTLHMLHVWFSYHCCHKHSKCPSSSVPDPINHFDAFASINFLQRLLCTQFFFTFFIPFIAFVCVRVCVFARTFVALATFSFFRIKSKFACF